LSVININWMIFRWGWVQYLYLVSVILKLPVLLLDSLTVYGFISTRIYIYIYIIYIYIHTHTSMRICIRTHGNFPKSLACCWNVFNLILVSIILSVTTNLFILVYEKALQSVDINKTSLWNHCRFENKNDILCGVGLFGRSDRAHSEWSCHKHVFRGQSQYVWLALSFLLLFCYSFPSFCSAVLSATWAGIAQSV
jgi:hypothetical protein